MEVYHLLAVVMHFLLGHLSAEARASDFWSQLRQAPPPECYPLSQEAQSTLWARVLARSEDAARQQVKPDAVSARLRNCSSRAAQYSPVQSIHDCPSLASRAGGVQQRHRRVAAPVRPVAADRHQSQR